MVRLLISVENMKRMGNSQEHLLETWKSVAANSMLFKMDRVVGWVPSIVSFLGHITDKWPQATLFFFRNTDTFRRRAQRDKSGCLRETQV